MDLPFASGGGIGKLFLHVTPKGSLDQIVGIETYDDRARLKVKVRAQPEKGKANKAVVELIAKWIGIAKSNIGVVSGETSRFKTLEVSDEDGELERLCGELLLERSVDDNSSNN